jgi:hypothetical protein
LQTEAALERFTKPGVDISFDLITLARQFGGIEPRIHADRKAARGR